MAYTRLGSTLTQAIINDVLTALELQNANQHGRGIMSGLAITDDGDYDLAISAGTMVGLKPTSIAATSAVMPPSSTVYVWIDEAGTVTTTATTADPGGTAVCLGKVTTDGSGITAVASDGRMDLPRMSAIRTWSCGPLRVDVSTGYLHFNGGTPAARTAISDPAAFNSADNEIGGLTIGATYSQGEVQALRDKCEELADDCRALRATVAALIDALQAQGVV